MRCAYEGVELIIPKDMQFIDEEHQCRFSFLNCMADDLHQYWQVSVEIAVVRKPRDCVEADLCHDVRVLRA